MKKLLLPALLLAGCAYANAEKVVLFSEDFEWIEPWVTATGAKDNFADNDEATSTPRWDIGYILDEELGDAEGKYYLRNACWNLNRGYWAEDITNEGVASGSLGAQTVYFGKNWLKFGKKNYQTRFRFEVGAEAPEDAVCTLEFDWAPWRAGATNFDPTGLKVLVDNGGVTEVVGEFKHSIENGSELQWCHAVVDLDGYVLTPTTRIIISPDDDNWMVSGQHRWCLDNIEIYYETSDEPAEAGRVFFQDDFSWLAPWVAADGLGDPVGTNDVAAKVVRTMDSTLAEVDGGYGTIYSYMTDASLKPAGTALAGWPSPGYLYRFWDNSAWYTIYAADGYFRIGGEGQTGGLRTPSFVVPEDAEDLWLEFDWCPVKNANGEYAATTLYVEGRPGNVAIESDITSELTTGDPYAWQHVEINLFDNGMTPMPANPTASTGFNVIIQSTVHGGDNWFFLDNIRIAETLLSDGNSGVKDINVEDNTNAPVEYYNLQGVRVANPESGLYIRRQGNKATKVVLR